jgi:ribosome maturation factor RimP
MADALDRDIEEQVARLGFELIELERTGSPSRPILRLRIDRPDAVPGAGVSLEDCTRVSRAIEASLDVREGVSRRYVLEVSSPGVDRPLVRRHDFERFAGHEVALHGKEALHEGAKRIEGELLGITGEEGDERVLLRTAAGEELAIPRSRTKRIQLVHRWGGGEPRR